MPAVDRRADVGKGEIELGGVDRRLVERDGRLQCIDRGVLLVVALARLEARADQLAVALKIELGAGKLRFVALLGSVGVIEGRLKRARIDLEKQVARLDDPGLPLKATLTIWPSTRVFTSLSCRPARCRCRAPDRHILGRGDVGDDGKGGTCVDAAARALSRPISATTNQPTTIKPATAPAIPTWTEERLFIRGKLHRRIASVHPKFMATTSPYAAARRTCPKVVEFAADATRDFAGEPPALHGHHPRGTQRTASASLLCQGLRISVPSSLE